MSAGVFLYFPDPGSLTPEFSVGTAAFVGKGAGDARVRRAVPASVDLRGSLRWPEYDQPGALLSEPTYGRRS
jgi:hypothetical protein